MYKVCTDKLSVFLLFCEKGGRQAALFFLPVGRVPFSSFHLSLGDIQYRLAGG
jgi:hypothetical protein